MSRTLASLARQTHSSTGGPNRRPVVTYLAQQAVYARLVAEWIGSIGLDPHLFGTHSLRRTKATLIYRRTGNLRAVQLLPGHPRLEARFAT